MFGFVSFLLMVTCIQKKFKWFFDKFLSQSYPRGIAAASDAVTETLTTTVFTQVPTLSSTVTSHTITAQRGPQSSPTTVKSNIPYETMIWRPVQPTLLQTFGPVLTYTAFLILMVICAVKFIPSRPKSAISLTKREQMQILREEYSRALTKSTPTKAEILLQFNKAYTLDQVAVTNIVQSSTTKTIKALITPDLVKSTVLSALQAVLPPIIQNFYEDFTSLLMKAPWLVAARQTALDTLSSVDSLQTGFGLLGQEIKELKTMIEPQENEITVLIAQKKPLQARVDNILSHVKLLSKCCAGSSHWELVTVRAEKLLKSLQDFVCFGGTERRHADITERLADLELWVATLNKSPCPHAANANANTFSSKSAVRADLSHMAASNEPTQQIHEIRAHRSPVPTRAVSKITLETPAPYTASPTPDVSSSGPVPSVIGSPQPQAPDSEPKKSLSDQLGDIASRVARLSDSCSCGSMQGLKKELEEQCEGCSADLRDPRFTVDQEIISTIETDVAEVEAHECQLSAVVTTPDRGRNTDQSDLSKTTQTAETTAPDHGLRIGHGDLSNTAQNTTEMLAADQGRHVDQSNLNNTAQNTTEMLIADLGRQVDQSNLRYDEKEPAETLGEDQGRKSDNDNLSSTAQMPVGTSGLDHGPSFSDSGLSSTPILPPVESTQIDEADLYDSSPQTRPVTGSITDVPTLDAMSAPPGDSSSIPVLSAPSERTPTTEVLLPEVEVQQITREVRGSRLMKLNTDELEELRLPQAATSSVATQIAMATNFHRREEICHHLSPRPSDTAAMAVDMDTDSSKEEPRFLTANLSSTAATAMEIDAGDLQETLNPNSAGPPGTADIAMDLGTVGSQGAASLPSSGVLDTTDIDMHTGELPGTDFVDTPNSFGITDTAMDTGGLEEAESLLAPNPAHMTDTVMDTDPVELPLTGSIPSFDLSRTADTVMETNSGGSRTAGSIPSFDFSSIADTAMETNSGGSHAAGSIPSFEFSSIVDTAMKTNSGGSHTAGSVPSFEFSSIADTAMKTKSGGSHTAGHAPASTMSSLPHFGMHIGPSALHGLSSTPSFQSSNEGSFRKPGLGRYGLKALASRRGQTILPQANVPQAILPSMAVANSIGPTSVVPQSAEAAPTLPAPTLPAMMVPRQDIKHMNAPNTPIPQSIRADETVPSAAPQTRTLNTASVSAVSKKPTSYKRPPTTSGVKPLLPKEPTSRRTYFMAPRITSGELTSSGGPGSTAPGPAPTVPGQNISTMLAAGAKQAMNCKRWGAI